MVINNVALSTCRLFDGIRGEDLNKMLVCLGCTTESYKKGEVVFSEGSHITKIGVLLSGGVMPVKDDFFGNRSIIGTVGVGDVFCEAFAATDTLECLSRLSLPRILIYFLLSAKGYFVHAPTLAAFTEA